VIAHRPITNATEAQAERAIAVLKRAIEAAENSNQAGENFVVAAAAGPELLAFANKWMRFAKATFAPVDIDAGLRELGCFHELTITCEQFEELTDAARAAIAKATGGAA
jgi:ectoine hydroxylase-related dioxygenase (phytanoyl-CoA dioxygenase family)